MKPSSFKLGITSFLWLTSVSALVMLVAICLNSWLSMLEIGRQAQNVRQVQLPEVEETQRSFINIESLRRLVEVVYMSDDAQTRRMTRLKAQALSTESVFTRNTDFYSKSKVLIDQLGKMNAMRDRETLEKKNLRETGQMLLLSANRIADKVARITGNQQLQEDLLATTLSISLFQKGTVSKLKGGISQNGKALKADDKILASVTSICTAHVERDATLMPLCARQEELRQNYVQSQQRVNKHAEEAFAIWQIIDNDLQEMRDVVRTDAEFETKDALSSIEASSGNAVRIALWFAAVGGVFFVIYMSVIHFTVIRPIRWAGRKLMEIQQGVLYTPAPQIHITELYQVGDLLDRFSVHIAELTSHASQLEEDAAIKKDLEALMSAVFKVSVDGYVIWTPNQSININTELTNILGYSSTAEVEENWDNLGFTPKAELQALYDKVRTEQFIRRELLVTSATGEHIPFEVSYLPLQRQNGISILSYFRDLRLQKMTEEALRSAKNKAEEAARVKSDFLARMSHEIRTPMNGVLGLTAIALKKSPPPESKNYLEKIQASARILLGVINDILDFSKMESGRFELESRAFPLTRLTETVTDMFEMQAKERNLEFSITTDPNIPKFIVGDELRLSQVLLNLCSNALKFTETGGVQVKINKENEDDKTLRLHFAIVDSGIGMTKQQLAALFKPFAQADSSTTRKYGGTGLGLVISDMLVKMMQGNIRVNSTPEVGSTFSFSINLKKPDAPGALGGCAYAELSSSNDSNTLKSVQGLRVLLAEDNEINQEVALALLDELGCITTVVNNGEAVLNTLETLTVDCILMDIQMPVMDGLTTAGIIRKDPRNAINNLPIVAMTAHAMQEDREKSIAAGMSWHVTKPIDFSELQEVLIQVAKKQAGR